MFNKSKINFIIDALMFFCITGIAGLGFLMKYVLIPGKERMAKYGRNVELLLFNMDRHEWGTIHLTIGFVLLGLLVLHIILHWKMIVSLYRNLITRGRARAITASVFIIVCAILVIFPFTVKPEVRELGRGRGHAHRHYVGEAEEAIKYPEKDAQDRSHEVHDHSESSLEVRGYMTLAEVAERYRVPIEYLKEHLGIPKSISDDERLRWLREEYGLRMSDVARAIDEYHKPH